MKYKFIDNDEQHLHTLDMVPLLGTSTVLEIIAKPLTWWASGMACSELGWTNSKIKNVEIPLETRMLSAAKSLDEIKAYTPEQWLKRLDKAYRAHKDNLTKSAKKGTDLHAELERFVKNRILAQLGSAKDTTEYEPKIKPFIEWADKEVKRFLFSEMHTFSEKHWLGGVVDCGVELNNGEYALIDFKSSKEAYDNQFWQIGGYHIQIEENGGWTADGEKVFTLDKPITQHIVVPFGTEPVVPVIDKEVGTHKEAFLAALTLYKLSNKFLQ